MKGFLDYLIKLGKFAGFCLVALIFSQWIVIRVEHSHKPGHAIRISHEGAFSPSVEIKVDHHIDPYTTLRHSHSGSCSIR